MRADEPSQTALGVAVARSRLDRPTTPTGDPAGEAALTASLFDDASDRQKRRLEEERRNWAPDADTEAGRSGSEWRGFGGFVVARTAFFDAAVLQAIQSGLTQVVIFGAGYDGRALRFRTPGVRFFEVDHPATQADKRSRLDRQGVASDDITFVAVDLTEPGLTDVLAAAGHLADEPTLFIVEGLLRYLPEQWFRGLLSVTAHRAAPGSDLAASISTERPDEHDDEAAERHRRERRLADSGEPVLTVPSRDLALQWLAEAGWTLDSVADASDTDPAAHRGRLLVHAHP